MHLSRVQASASAGASPAPSGAALRIPRSAAAPGPDAEPPVAEAPPESVLSRSFELAHQLAVAATSDALTALTTPDATAAPGTPSPGHPHLAGGSDGLAPPPGGGADAGAGGVDAGGSGRPSGAGSGGASDSAACLLDASASPPDCAEDYPLTARAGGRVGGRGGWEPWPRSLAPPR